MSCRPPADFCAAIFDLDGTLLDSMSIWEKIDKDFLGRRGLPVPQDYVAAIAPLSFRETARYTIERFHLSESEEGLMEEWSKIAEEEYALRVPLKPGAREYLEALKVSGVKLATATSLSHRLSAPALRRNGVYGLFDAQCSTDELAAGRREKRHPDLFLLAAKKLAVRPETCIVFEDILPAVMGAKSAGMKVYCIADEASSAHAAELAAASAGYLADFSEAPYPRSAFPSG